MRYILAIDPSTTRLGWATLRLPLLPDAPSLLAAGWAYGSLKVTGDNIFQKMRSIEPLLTAGTNTFWTQLVIELPMFYNTEKGRIASKEGYITNLAMIVGYIAGRLAHVPVEGYTAPQWKGMVSKEITRKKFYRTFRDAAAADKYGQAVTYDHDTLDAIMILHHWLTQKR